MVYPVPSQPEAALGGVFDALIDHEVCAGDVLDTVVRQEVSRFESEVAILAFEDMGICSCWARLDKKQPSQIAEDAVTSCQQSRNATP
jgi:hypothetical protein